MNEQNIIVAVAPPAPAPDLTTLVPPKRKKGRPPKNRDLVPAGENSTAPPPPKPDGRGRKPKRKSGDVAWPVVDGSFVGQQVHGVLDGSFDAGYLLTVRVGNSQTVLRGAVFEPTLSVPLSRAIDIAPHVKFISRSEVMAPPLPCPEEHAANPAFSSLAVVPTVTSCNVESAPMESTHMESAPLESAPVPMEEDRPSGPPSSEPGPPTPPVVTTDYHKDAASYAASSLPKDHEKVDLHPEQQSQTELVVEGHES